MTSKLRKGSVRRKKPEKDADKRLKKELFLIYNCFAAFANACEKTWPRSRAALFKTITVEAGKARAEKHLDRAIIGAETWDERDKLFRRLASQCYQTATWLKQSGDLKQAAKWMNLTLRYLRLSLDPRAKEMERQVDEQLQTLERLIKEAKAAKEEAEKRASVSA